jgi:hypothetical protein
MRFFTVVEVFNVVCRKPTVIKVIIITGFSRSKRSWV